MEKIKKNILEIGFNAYSIEYRGTCGCFALACQKGEKLIIKKAGVCTMHQKYFEEDIKKIIFNKMKNTYMTHTEAIMNFKSIKERDNEKVYS
jgi:hypothetical protein